MKIIIFGGTGLIGKKLLDSSLCKGSEIVLISRNANRYSPFLRPNEIVVGYDEKLGQSLEPHMDGDYGIINLAGESISKWPWNAKQKDKILKSRTGVTEQIASLVTKSQVKPKVIIQGSASGYYGSDPELVFTENSPPGTGFLADVVLKWENSLVLDDPSQTRLVFLRTGLVLGREGGLLPRLMTPFRLMAGGHFGNGRQWMPWIHIDDEVSAIEFLFRHQNLEGPCNIVAPNPVQMKQMMRLIGKLMNRPSWLHAPAIILKLILGQFADELMLSSQRIVPNVLTNAGFTFQFPEIEDALKNLILKGND